jgi:predicted metal-binding membrane protein
MSSARISERNFLGTMALLFVGSVTLAIIGCRSMSQMHEMPMPGGWRMSMMWIPMPGQTRPGAAATFLGMWLAMMIAMMLPSLLPMLQHYRRALALTDAARLDWLTAIAGVAYFVVWMLFGLAAFVIGAALTSLEMALPPLARAVPFATGTIVAIAGAAQLSAWKRRQLACCRGAHACRAAARANAQSAWQHGMTLGAQCVRCCFGITIAMLVAGTMDLRVMAFATAAISAERLAPGGEYFARLFGLTMFAAGLWMLGSDAIG